MDNLTFSKALQEMKAPVNTKINEIVKEMLAKHEGGKQFFENLDLAVKDPDVIEALYDLIDHKMKGTMVTFVTTGKFGRFFANWIQTFGFDFDIVFVVNGGIREDEPLESLEFFKEGLDGETFVVVDDSYYSGRTSEIIRKHVESLGGEYGGTFVVYDGSKEKNKNVHSLYRYYESK